MTKNKKRGFLKKIGFRQNRVFHPYLKTSLAYLGIFDGCFITMLGPIAYDLCGPSGASQAVGFLLGLCSIPLTIGPLIAGLFCLFLCNNYKNTGL